MGTGKGTGKSMRTRLSKLPFSKLPFSFSPIRELSEGVKSCVPSGLEDGQKTGKGKNWHKNKMAHGPKLGKMAPNWRKRRKMTPTPLFRPFWAIFAACGAVGHFLLFGQFFLHFQFSARFDSPALNSGVCLAKIGKTRVKSATISDKQGKILHTELLKSWSSTLSGKGRARNSRKIARTPAGCPRTPGGTNSLPAP